MNDAAALGFEGPGLDQHLEGGEEHHREGGQRQEDGVPLRGEEAGREDGEGDEQDVAGEQVREVEVVPAITANLDEQVYLFPDTKPKEIALKIRSFTPAARGF